MNKDNAKLLCHQAFAAILQENATKIMQTLASNPYEPTPLGSFADPNSVAVISFISEIDKVKGWKKELQAAELGNSKYGQINALAKRQKQDPDADLTKYTAEQWKAFDASRSNQIGQSMQGRWGSAINHGIFASADRMTIAFGNTVVKYPNPLPEVFNAANCPAKFAPSNDPEKRNKWCKHPEACWVLLIVVVVLCGFFGGLPPFDEQGAKSPSCRKMSAGAPVWQRLAASAQRRRPLSNLAGRNLTEQRVRVQTSEQLDKLDEVAMKPRDIVGQLDRYIVGQSDAKRAVAVAMRNRWRRQRVEAPLKEDIMPKNILMVGPTGVGKTEVARRLAKFAAAPFVKVEATKFTEVGFVGKDVDQIIRDLVEVGISIAKAQALDAVKDKVTTKVEETLLDCLVGPANIAHNREAFRKLLRMGHLDDRVIEIEVPEKKHATPPGLDASNNGLPMNEIVLRFDKMLATSRPRMEKREMRLKDSVGILTDLESERLINEDRVKRAALQLVEQDGIVFIDEIDKICSKHDFRGTGDASSEGVQRDLLPLLEGSAVATKHGTINTDHILFIASGAFHSARPSDLLAELQGRLPIRVELKSLAEEDLYTILTEPENNLCRQQVAMMATEGVHLEIEDEAKRLMASLATQINKQVVLRRPEPALLVSMHG